MELFDFIRILFEKTQEYKALSRYDRAKFFFMTNRFMSIMYPVQADAFNHTKMPQAEVIDYWQKNMANVYTKVPNWIYAKGAKKSSAEKAKKLPAKEAIKFYLERTKFTKRQLDDAYQLFGESVYDPIRRIEKSME